MNSTGNTTWTANGVTICTASNYQWDPQLCSDGQGGAIIAWHPERSEGMDCNIYVQHLKSDGTIPTISEGGETGGGGAGGGGAGGGGGGGAGEETPSTTAIPGYELLVLIGVVCISSAILIKRCKKM